MIKPDDYIILDDFGYKVICKVVSPGPNKTVRKISIRAVYPDNIGKDAFSIVVDMRRVVVLDDQEAKVVKCLYEE